MTVTLSFLQLYRETIQDLLAPATQQAFSNSDDTGDAYSYPTHIYVCRLIIQSLHSLTGSLQVREDPSRGFYVDGLQEFIVRSYHEAETLVNLGKRFILTYTHRYSTI